MTRKYRLYQIDSFTKEKFTGNPAGVITNADGLTEEEMMKIARELNNSETAFIFSPDTIDYDVYIRYFTPLKEVPICGHATIAAHYARAIEKNLDTITIMQKSRVGILPVDINRINDDYKIVMTQGKIEFGTHIEGANRKVLLLALGIEENDLLESCPIEIVSTGYSKVMICIKSSIKLNQLKPNYNALSEISEIIACNGLYVFTMDSKENNILVKGRMFAPIVGVNEDPVTGNANGPLGAYLVRHKLVQHNGTIFRFNAKQGEAMGRAGIIGVEVNIENNEPVKVRISGEAVTVFQSELII